MVRTAKASVAMLSMLTSFAEVVVFVLDIGSHYAINGVMTSRYQHSAPVHRGRPGAGLALLTSEKDTVAVRLRMRYAVHCPK